MKFLSVFLIFMATAGSIIPDHKEATFKIYCFDNDSAGYKLSAYEYDSTWTDFMKSENLKKASFVISETEIEYYDWEKQELKLTGAGSEQLNKLKIKNNSLAHLKFIVVLENKRLYAGEFLSFMSAMAINHPVIHYDIGSISEGKAMLRIYPIHTNGNITAIPLSVLSRTKINGVMKFFKRIEKLK